MAPTLLKTQQGKLLRILGISFGIAVTIGATIGVGILRTPGSIAANLGSFWPIIAVWLIGGIYALFGTIAAAELGTSLPHAGGWYVYARRALGTYGGFVIGWSDWISGCVGQAYVAVAFSEYIGILLPSLSSTSKVIAVTTVLLLALLNWQGLQIGSRTQEITSLIKAVAFITLIIACFVFALNNPSTVMEPRNQPLLHTGAFVAFMLSLQPVIATYDGWYSAIYFTEETVNPERNLPRSMVSGTMFIIAIYLLTNLGLLLVLPLHTLAGSTLPAADAARVIFGEHSGKIITLIALVSLPSLMNAGLMTISRIMFAMSRDGLFISGAARVNRGGTPTIALLFTVIVTTLLIISGTFDQLLAIAAFLYVVIYSSGFLSLFILRKREPKLLRPFRAWGYPWTPLIVLVGSIAFLIGVTISDPVSSGYAASLIILSYPLYLIVRRRLVNGCLIPHK